MFHHFDSLLPTRKKSGLKNQLTLISLQRKPKQKQRLAFVLEKADGLKLSQRNRLQKLTFFQFYKIFQNSFAAEQL